VLEDPNIGFTLRQLSHFAAVAETGTISEAAARLHLTPSAVSASITELERILGIELCVRRQAQGVSLTPSGIQVLDQARGVLSLAAELDYGARGRDGSLTGPVAIGCYVTIAATTLSPLLVELQETHPAIRVRTLEGTQDQLKRGLGDGELDLVVTYDYELPAWVETLPLAELRPHAVLGAAHPLATAPSVTLEALAGYPMVLFDMPPAGANVLSIFADAGLAPDIRYRTQTYEFTRSLVARSDCFSVLVQRPDSGTSYEGLPVVTRDIDSPIPMNRVVLAWSRTAPLSPRASAVVRFARRRLTGRSDGAPATSSKT